MRTVKITRAQKIKNNNIADRNKDDQPDLENKPAEQSE